MQKVTDYFTPDKARNGNSAGVFGRLFNEALIQINRQGEQMRIRVEDEGYGFDVSTKKEGSFGLKIMRERIEGIGGRLKIDRKPGQEVRITLFYSANVS